MNATNREKREARIPSAQRRRIYMSSDLDFLRLRVDVLSGGEVVDTFAIKLNRARESNRGNSKLHVE